VTQPNLADFLARGEIIARERQIWGAATTLDVASYLCAALPPLTYTTSVRAIILRGDEILAAQQGPVWHIMPGGRREGDEALAATLGREILEESGWTIVDATLLDCLHLHHLTPQAPGYRSPYPDFLQPIYLARAHDFRPEALLPNEYEPDPYTFRPIAEALILPLPEVERRFLDAILRQRGG
jgi:8-oxo-dGTP pyrophosphatase MutT (NUDIX family)